MFMESRPLEDAPGGLSRPAPSAFQEADLTCVWPGGATAVGAHTGAAKAGEHTIRRARSSEVLDPTQVFASR